MKKCYLVLCFTCALIMCACKTKSKELIESKIANQATPSLVEKNVQLFNGEDALTGDVVDSSNDEMRSETEAALNIMDKYIMRHVRGKNRPEQVRRVSYLSNDDIVVAVYINGNSEGTLNISYVDGVYNIPAGIGRDFYMVSYSHSKKECTECVYLPSSADYANSEGQQFTLFPIEGGIIWINVLPNVFGWVERTSAQIWFVSENGLQRYSFSEEEDDYLWGRTHKAWLESAEKLVIYESDTDADYFDRIVNEGDEAKLRWGMNGYIPEGYTAIKWNEKESLDIAKIAESVDDSYWDVLSEENMTDQDALSVAMEYFELETGAPNRFGTIVEIKKIQDGSFLLVMKILGILDDLQSVMLIKSSKIPEECKFVYFIGTSAVFERDEKGLKLRVTASWQGSPEQIVADGYAKDYVE